METTYFEAALGWIRIRGGAGNDNISGDDGDDILYGDAGDGWA